MMTAGGERLTGPVGAGAIDAALAAGRRALPDVALERGAFAAHLERAGAAEVALAAYAVDLYLAAACAAGQAPAIAHFDAAYLSQVPAYVSRVTLGRDGIDEVQQALRIRLLTGTPPKIALYAGTGPLGAWVRVAALRVALTLAKAPARDDDRGALETLVGRERTPEMAALAGAHRPTVQAALEEALAALAPRDRTILRMHFVDGLGIDALGAAFQVHRATAARWLIAVRRRVLQHLTRALAIELRSSTTEVRSLIAVFGGELHLSIDRVLGDRG